MPSFDDDFWKDIAPGEGRLSGPLGEFGIHAEGEPACTGACPAGVDVKAYVNLIADRRYERAVEVIRRSNPFPGVCGRVCTHPCESACKRSEVDDPLAIRALKRFASDYEMARKAPVSPIQPSHEERIAIIGAGPAGLTAAANLAYEGFSVDVYDSAHVAGGIMAWGIPEFRLPKRTLRSEVKDIEDLGVRILLNEHIKDPKGLLDKGYSAIVLAIGCMSPITLGLEGEDSGRIIDCLEFLRKANTGGHVKLEGRVLVIGGGSAALDSARTAVRLGADATVVYRRSIEQMPASPEEIREAEEEGVKLEYLAMPNELKFEGYELRALKCQRTILGEPDERGRCRPVPVDEFFELEADRIILAIGSEPETTLLKEMETTGWGTVKVDESSMTSVPGIFSAGDVVTGPASIVEAIGSGHDAARGIIRYLTGESVKTVIQPQMLVVEANGPDRKFREKTTSLQAENRSTGFDEVDLGFSETSALAEASRCRRCGSCSVCDVCLGVCEHSQAVATDDSGNSVLIKVPRTVHEILMKGSDADNKWVLSNGHKNINLSLSTLLASVNPDKCIACGICDEVCVYRAVRVRFTKDGVPTAVVDPSACRACGACSAACPTGAISQGHAGWSQLRKYIRSGNEIEAFSCIWRNTEAFAGNALNLMCTRAASPALIFEALAAGAKAVVLIGCDRDCHYLPGPWMGEDVVELSKAILEAAGHDPERVKYLESADLIESILAALSEDLGLITPTPCGLPDIDSPLGITLHAAMQLAREPHRKGTILDAVMVAYALEGPGKLFDSKASLDALGNPEFLQTRINVAYHSCSDPDSEFGLLNMVPGLTAIKIDGGCGQTGWTSPTALARAKAVRLLKKAESNSADVLVVDSPECLTHLRAVQRGWKESHVDVVDVYSFLLSRLREGSG
jgi:NADPH-dependent glutamate synthase beta subunit-like oxidoreductase/ferredoxin/coenzyme F420-reducing hydrogenase delta subunit